MTIPSVRALLQDRPLHAIAPGDSVAEACAALDRYDIGALAVIEADDLVGILSERDIIRDCNAKGRDITQTRVSEIMTPEVRVIFIDDSLAEALTTMLEGRFRHVPVVDDEGAPIGMLSMRDIPTDYRLMVERYRGYLSPAA